MSTTYDTTTTTYCPQQSISQHHLLSTTYEPPPPPAVAGDIRAHQYGFVPNLRCRRTRPPQLSVVPDDLRAAPICCRRRRTRPPPPDVAGDVRDHPDYGTVRNKHGGPKGKHGYRNPSPAITTNTYPLSYQFGCIMGEFLVRVEVGKHWETLLDTYLKSPMLCKVLIEQLPDEETPVVPKKKSKRKLYLEWHEESEVPKVGESSVEHVVDVEIGESHVQLPSVDVEIGESHVQLPSVDVEIGESHVEIPSSQLDDFDPFFGINFDDGFEDQGSRVMEDQAGRVMEDQAGRGMEDQTGRGMEDQDGWGMDDEAGRGMEDQDGWGMDDQAADDGIVDEGNIIKDAVEVDVDMSSFNFSFVDPEDDVPVNLEDFESASNSDADLESLRRKKLRQVRRQKQKEQPTSVSFYVGNHLAAKQMLKIFTGTSSDKGKEAMSSEQACPWVLHVSPVRNEETWMVKTYKEGHRCLQTRSVNACTAAFLSEHIKGIVPAIADVLPSAEHRYCLRHIEENLKQRHKGKAFKDHLWKCAAASTVQMYNKAMDELKSFNESAHSWLKQIPLNTGPKLTSLYLMKKIVNVQKVIANCDGPLTPVATKMLDKNKADAVDYDIIWNGGIEYEVIGPWQDQVIVNVQKKTCSCRHWELTGMPCKHAVVTNWYMAMNGEGVGLPENWVHECYWLSTWQKVYSFKLSPINGPKLWPENDCPTTLTPPKHHIQVGRPKKKRVRTTDDASQSVVKGNRVTRAGTSVTCAKCHKKGYNSRTCKGI
ncbi:hypothetical protein OSB04_un001534 [Centaurea solstitialis]|uniref:SWIM-type domain-containing protein n=1 Tax=Centaurea solstitialis TaxID=347529 RepID=A0AA38W4X9_9ASTR|nr:hypothetical protein OSB04_un001534 [Centaurea solstitialis]